jgi:hypothetical protein
VLSAAKHLAFVRTVFAVRFSSNFQVVILSVVKDLLFFKAKSSAYPIISGALGSSSVMC